MPTLFRVESRDITDLNDIQLTRLLKLLLHLEARSSGIADRAVDVALNITVADGGEDGRIKWEGGPDNTCFLPSRFCQFQNKATEMRPTDCANEIVASDGSMKRMVEDALDNGAAYILFTNQELNTYQKIPNRIKNIREKLIQLGKAYAETVTIEIYDAAKIEGWVNKYISAIVAVLNWVGRPLERGLKTWSDWGQQGEYQRFSFVADEDRKAALDSIKSLLNVPGKCARIVGLSGLGKSRLAFEAFRDVDELDDFSKRVVYVDACANSAVLGLITDWVQCGLEGIVVVDNCDISLHEKIRREIQRADSNLSALTLDYNLDRANHTVIIQLRQLPDENIKQMLAPVYGDQISDLDRIVSFAQGFPQMAVLLADARLENEPEMGRLSDDDLAHKMLWGGREHDEKDEKILKGCALFDRFGLDDEVSPEYEFIAEKVVEVSADDFFDCVKRFEERGIIDRRGRFAKLVPKPLAIRLAAEWWRRTRPQKQMGLIESEMPGLLVESFCDQVSRLDFLPEVKALTEELCGPQGPFGQAEVILSDRGSRLFRSFVEVNPIATSRALANVLNPLNDGDLKAIDGDIRRNLVWALEKLCFHEECFEEAANSLLLLASAENETWSNNATGQFKQLFRLSLSGTEASPTIRLKVIDNALASGRNTIRKLAVSALDVAIQTYGGSRSIGAEYQGSGEPLKEWQPKVWGDIFEYWKQALLRLCNLVVEGDVLASDAKKTIGHHIRGLMQNGQVDILDIIIRRIVESKGPLWPEALDGIKDSLRYEGDQMPKEGKAKLNDWIHLLTPSDLAERLKLYVTIPPFEHEKGSDGHYVDIAAQNAKALAEELAPNLESLIPYLDKLLIGEQRQTYCFGTTLFQSSNNWEELLSKTIEVVLKIDKPNINLLLGMLNGIHRSDPTYWESIIDRLVETESLLPFYALLLTSGEVNKSQLNKLIELIRLNKIPPVCANMFSYGRPLEHLSTDIVKQFVMSLADTSNDGAWVSLEILSMYCHTNPERFNNCKPTFFQIVIKLNLDKKNEHSQLDVYLWRDIVVNLLSSEGPEFAKLIAKKIVESCTDKLDYSDLYHYVKPTTRKLFQLYGREVWPIFAESIRNAEALEKYRLTELLSSEDRFDKKETSVLAELPDDLLREWCAQEPATAPVFVAGATDVLLDVKDGYQISPRARFLLDNFGDDDRVLSALSANIGSFGWTGSLVPYYQKELAALETIKEHENAKVREWVKRRIVYLNKMIDKETLRDEEHDWGIY
ncbi:MAG: hypothetical protein VB050_18115 [Geobacteraceae bacterium]|nr:hypothetical protein [Geobacteraceae bacterium]